MNRIAFFIIVFIFYFTFSGISQNSDIRSIRLFKSKLNYSVNAVFQDQSGFLWFGTSEGLVSYDGLKFTYYSVKDSLAENQVTAINQDSTGCIWIGHSNGKISLIDKKIIRQSEPEEGLGKEKITSFLKDSKSNIWFSTSGEGVYYFKGKRLYNLNQDDGLTDNYTYCMAEDSKGNIWIGTDAGLSKYEPSTQKFTNFSMKNGLPDNIVKSIAVDKQDRIWIGMEDGGVCRFDPDNLNVFLLQGWKFGSINNLILSKESDIWVCTKNYGVIKIRLRNNQPDYRIFNKDNGLLNNQIKTIFEDREENIWFGAENGINLFTGDLFSFLNPEYSPEYNQIYNFLIDDLNNYWFCAESGLYRVKKSIYNELTIEKIFKNTKQEKQHFISLHKDKDGNIWVGTYGNGVYKINPQNLSWKNYTTKDGLANENIISITGKQNILCFSTLGGGVSMFDTDNKKGFLNFDSKNGLPASYVYSCYIDSKNRTWFALDGGNIARLENGKIIAFHDSAISSAIYGYFEDKHENLYAYTSSEGIYKITDDKISKVVFDKEFQEESILSVALDAENLLHVITNEGIQCFNMNNLKWINTFSEEDKIANKNPNLNAVFQDKEGAIWIGTKQGLVKYNPHYQKRLLSPSIFISSVKLFYQDISTEKSVFNHNENHLIFNFTGIWFTAPENVYYRYQLEGFDLNWSAVTQTYIATYSNLPAGKYKFRAQVSNNGENWEQPGEATFSFIIKPPLWKTWWFITLCVICSIGGTILLIRWRINILIRQKNHLELEVQKRTSEILKQKEELQTQHDVIKLKNKSITDSINYASRIQQAILPPEKEFSDILPESFILFKPKDIVSGDFYWINKKENEVIVTAADCTGHGVPGAFMSMLGISLLSEIVNRHPTQTAAEILNRLREQIKNSLRQVSQDNKSKDGMDIALCAINTVSLTLQFAGAYNPLYRIRNGELTEIKGDRMPIGIHIKEKDTFTNNTIQLEKNDMIYLFSDGFVDQAGGPENRKFLSINFKKLLLEIYTKSMHEQKLELEIAFEKWTGENEQVDDILVMGIRI
jgi:ligand-binding sensor domain-containing protein/serine phosphatase RsbU (regulator of sigma subunit)